MGFVTVDIGSVMQEDGRRLNDLHAGGDGGAPSLETKYLTLERSFIFRNPYRCVQGIYSGGIFLSNELTGDSVVIELHRERAGILLDLLLIPHND